MAESQPLLAASDDAADPPSYSEIDENKPDNAQSQPATHTIAEDELPPPYTPSAQSLPTHVNCKVCQAPISLEGRHHLYVIKCSVCNEATPIKYAPPGKKYIRCPCNCLLMCSVGAVRIACPRENCRRMISLPPPTVHFGPNRTVAVVQGQSVRARCVHCQQVFVFLKQNMRHKLALCPHCGKRSAVGSGYIRRKVILFAALGVFFLLLGLITTLVSVYTEDGVGVYIVWIGAYIVGALNLLRAGLFCLVKVSQPLN